MSSVFEVKEVENLNVKFGKVIKHKEVYQIHRKDNERMNSTMVRDIYNAFEKKAGAPTNVMMRVLNSTGILTLKGFNEDTLNFEDFDDYFKNRVHSEKNFDQFYSIEITLMK